MLIYPSLHLFPKRKLTLFPASLVLSERFAWPSHFMKYDIKLKTHTDRNKCMHSWKAAASSSICQGKDKLLCETSLRQCKDYSPPISIKHSGNTLQCHVQWWQQWRCSEFNALWLHIWVLIGRIHIILHFTPEMNDSQCDMLPEHSLLPPAFLLCPQPLALADSLVICTSGIKGRRVSLRHNICYSRFQ